MLDAQPAEVRALLLSTSIPETLRPGLTEELGGRTAGRTLARLTRANAFIEPVPDNPGFYRYHPFFRDLLRAELEYESPELMDALQRRTADWFAHEGLVAAAASHYATIDAWTEIAQLVVDRLAVPDVLAKRGDECARAHAPLVARRPPRPRRRGCARGHRTRGRRCRTAERTAGPDP